MLSSAVEEADLLIEFLTEELPPLNLEKNIGEAFARNLRAYLGPYLSETEISYEFFVTPRRFGVIFTKVKHVALGKQHFRRGPSILQGLKNNQPTPALLGFAKSCKISNWQELEQRDDGYFYAKYQELSHTLEDGLPEIILTALQKLPVAKNMRWGKPDEQGKDYQFIRPVHNLMILYSDQILCDNPKFKLPWGLIPVNYTFGHRIMSQGKIVIKSATSYLVQIEEQGKVLPNFAKRREVIQDQLVLQAKKLNLVLQLIPGLLDEVTALVEYPVILQGEFERKFLEVPQECLILSMAKHQKYFALLDTDNKLSNKFLFVANIASPQPEIIIQGNQKVLAARLSDAKFFYEVDKKRPLGNFVEKLAKIVYHNQLGSQLERSIRLQNIAMQIAKLMNFSSATASHTAYLLKADLTSEMVGEFPELQGIMGKYYALNQGEKPEIANAIEQHYYPRFSGDKLPDSPLSTIMALADKLETLVGVWGIGLMPTGDKDPFALRRAALGIVRILLEENLNVDELLYLTFTIFAELNLEVNTVNEVYAFILNRLYNYLTTEKGFATNCVQSVCILKPRTFTYLPSLLEKLQKFASDEKNQPLLTANKRIENILKKNASITISLDVAEDLLSESAEQTLFKLLRETETIAIQYGREGDWNNYFITLAKFNIPVTSFFDNVMVIVDNIALQNNRLGLLLRLNTFLNYYCKLSEL